MPSQTARQAAAKPKKPRYTATLELITPEKAKAFLDAAGPNRKLSKAAVKRYASSLTEGRWDNEAPAMVILDDAGSLRDAQHRCEAVAQTGIPIWAMVCRGMPPASFSVLDTGAKRTAAQVLATQGTSYASIVASAAKYAQNYEAGVGLRTARDNDEVRAYYHANPTLEVLSTKSYPTAPLFGPSPFAAVMLLASRHAPGTVIDNFITGVCRVNETRYDVGDPRLLLRTWAEREKSRMAGALIRPEPLMMATSIAWNAFYSGKTLERPAQLTSPKIAHRNTMPILGFEPLKGVRLVEAA